MKLIDLSPFEGHTLESMKTTLLCAVEYLPKFHKNSKHRKEAEANQRLLHAAPALLAEDLALREENSKLRVLARFDENQVGGLAIKLTAQNATLRAENKRLRGLIIEFADKMTESIKALQGEEQS